MATAQQKAATAKWRMKNRDKDRARKAKWQAENRDRQRASNARSAAKKPAEARARSAAWAAANPDRKRESRAAWNKANPEKRRMYMARVRAKRKALGIPDVRYASSIASAKAWWVAHPEQRKATSRAASAKRRALKRGVPLGDLKVIAQWEAVWRGLDSVPCYWCRGSFPPSRCQSDHIHPLGKLGPHEIGNLCISCGSCNNRKKAKTLDRWNRELLEPVLL